MRVAVGQLVRTLGTCGRSLEGPGAEALGYGKQLSRSGVSAAPVAGRDRDLDLSGQTPDARKRVRHVL
jgi:hypothetical protein